MGSIVFPAAWTCRAARTQSQLLPYAAVPAKAEHLGTGSQGLLGS